MGVKSAKRREDIIILMFDSLKFDVSSIVQHVKSLPKLKLEGISITLPFVSFNITSSNKEQAIAREILIRLRDKRVLVAYQCCGSCIQHAVDSIQDIRQLLVEKQIEISDCNSALFIVVDLMLVSIRQFLTYIERFDPYSNRNEYQKVLELLRGHLLRCLNEIGKVGNTAPILSNQMSYDAEWDEKLYISLTSE